MSACVLEEGRISQTHEEIRAKFALPFNKTLPEVDDLNKLRINTSVICSVLDLKECELQYQCVFSARLE